MNPRLPGRRLAGLAARRAQEALSPPTRWVVLSALDATLSTADAALRSPLARDAVARVTSSPLADDVLQRVFAQTIGNPEVERLVAQTVDGADVERLVGGVIDSPLLDVAVARAFGSRLLDLVVARLLESDALWVLVDEIAQSPSVTAAISHQGVGFANQVAGVARDRSRTADDRLERLAARLTGRLGRSEPLSQRRAGAGTVTAAGPSSSPGVVYSGLVTRAIAIVIDAVLINAVALAVTGAVLLLESTFGVSRGHHDLAVATGSVLFFVWVAGYFATFWTTTGQTPGSRVMQIRVTRPDGARLGLRRAFVRLAWMVLSLPFLWGYLPILWTPRRRTVFDLVAGTIVAVAPSVPGIGPGGSGRVRPRVTRAHATGIEPPSTVP